MINKRVYFLGYVFISTTCFSGVCGVMRLYEKNTKRNYQTVKSRVAPSKQIRCIALTISAVLFSLSYHRGNAALSKTVFIKVARYLNFMLRWRSVSGRSSECGASLHNQAKHRINCYGFAFAISQCWQRYAKRVTI